MIKRNKHILIYSHTAMIFYLGSIDLVIVLRPYRDDLHTTSSTNKAVTWKHILRGRRVKPCIIFAYNFFYLINNYPKQNKLS